MQRKNDLLLIICLAFNHVAIAKDFGKQAATFEIKEEGFVLVWTSCKMQEKNNVNSKKANAVMYQAYS